MVWFLHNQPENSNVIVFRPNVEGQGWLVLNRKAYPDVVSWQVQIVKRTYFVTDSDTTYVDDIISKVDLGKTNYTKIPYEYLNNRDENYLLNIRGVNNQGEILANVEGLNLSVYPPAVDVGPQYNETGYWKCIGSTYAWEIQQYTSYDFGQTPMSYFTLQSTYRYFDENISQAIPYYQYMGEEEFNSIKNDITKQKYYGLNSNDISSLNYVNGVKIIKISNDGSTYDVHNQLITGEWIYGVQKFLGPWSTYFGPVVQVAYIPMDDMTGVPIDDIIQLMNNHYDFTGVGYSQKLACDQNEIDVTDVTEANYTKCLREYFDYQLGVDGDIFDQLNELHDCLYGTDTSLWDDHHGRIINITITPLSSDEASIILKYSDFFRHNGEFISPNIVLDKGLYTIGYLFKDKTYIPLIEEVKNSFVNQYELSNLLDVTIYPVPVQGDRFNLKMHASAKLKFDYILYDFNGNVLYRKHFVLQKGHDRDFTVRVNGGIPNGILINKFVFEDNSELTIQTTK